AVRLLPSGEGSAGRSGGEVRRGEPRQGSRGARRPRRSDRADDVPPDRDRPARNRRLQGAAGGMTIAEARPDLIGEAPASPAGPAPDDGSPDRMPPSLPLPRAIQTL